MRDYQRINVILEDIENLLNGLLLSGIGVIREGEMRELERLEGDCSRIGLKHASRLLSIIKSALDKKRHNLNFDSSEAVEACCALGSYLFAVRSKIKLDMAEESLSLGEEINMGRGRM